MRDRTKQINLDFTKYPEALEAYNRIPHNKTGFVADAIIEKDKAKGQYITREEVQEMINKAIHDYLDPYIIRIERLERLNKSKLTY